MSIKTIIVTGGAGFIGSNFIRYFLQKYRSYHIINLDKLTYASDLTRLKDFQDDTLYTFVKGDICDHDLLERLYDSYEVQGVIHFAAESHVDLSITSPEAFIQTNINGTFNLLRQSYQSWMDGPNQVKERYQNARFLHVSTDEVFGSLKDQGAFNETSPYKPNSPYSASKASSDMVVRSYVQTYGLNAIISNCSNNYGPRQHDEKFIPTIIKRAVSGQHIPIYGDGSNVRDWIYVLDHLKCLDLIYHNGKRGSNYNIGSGCELDNLALCRIVCHTLDQKTPRRDGTSYFDQVLFVQDRPGHDYRYAIDFSKVSQELGWQPLESFKSAIDQTVEWYLSES